MSRTPPEVRQAAQTLLDWHDALEDPRVQGVAHMQAVEAAGKAVRRRAHPIEQQRAFTRRYLESLARDNAGLIDMLSGKHGGAE